MSDAEEPGGKVELSDAQPSYPDARVCSRMNSIMARRMSSTGTLFGAWYVRMDAIVVYPLYPPATSNVTSFFHHTRYRLRSLWAVLSIPLVTNSVRCSCRPTTKNQSCLLQSANRVQRETVRATLAATAYHALSHPSHLTSSHSPSIPLRYSAPLHPPSLCLAYLPSKADSAPSADSPQAATRSASHWTRPSAPSPFPHPVLFTSDATPRLLDPLSPRPPPASLLRLLLRRLS